MEWLVNIKQTPGKRGKRGKEEWREGGLSGEEDLGGVGEEENMINNILYEKKLNKMKIDNLT